VKQTADAGLSVIMVSILLSTLFTGIHAQSARMNITLPLMSYITLQMNNLLIFQSVKSLNSLVMMAFEYVSTHSHYSQKQMFTHLSKRKAGS